MAGDTSPADAFASSRQVGEELYSWLGSDEVGALDHALETALDERGRWLLRAMFQDSGLEGA